jgi:hypothetical protein
VEFYQCRKLETVMVVVFEEMQSDLRSLLPHIVKFAGLHAVSSARLFDCFKLHRKLCALTSF